jgi:hypothetical protein
MPEFGHFGVIHNAQSNIGRCCVDTWGAGPFHITVGKRTFIFTDCDRFGPLLEDKRGVVLDDQPMERHAFWKGYTPWRKQGRRLAEDGKTCVWDAPKPTLARRIKVEGKRGLQLLIVEPGDEGGGTVIVD